MAGYFEHLVARALQPQAEIQPRLPARFEPVEPRLEPLWQPEDGLEEQAEVQPALPRPAAPVYPHPGLPGKTTPPDRMPVGERVPSPGSPPRAEVESVAPQTGWQTPAFERPQAHETEDTPPAAPAPLPAPPPGPRRGLRQETTAPPVTSPAIIPVLSQLPANQGVRPETAPQPQQPGRVVVQPTILPAPPKPRPEATSAQAEPSATPETPSRQVNVTIGRVEVRLTPPAAPDRKPRPAAPVMGLDEYLKKRTGGQR